MSLAFWHWDNDDYPAPRTIATPEDLAVIERIVGEMTHAMVVAWQQAVLECILETEGDDEEEVRDGQTVSA